MRSCATRLGVYRLKLLLLWLALFCAGCNLNVMPAADRAAFEGPPLISIAAPLPNQTFLAGTTVVLQARVENAGADLARVSVLLDEALLGEKLNPNETEAPVLPLTIDWPSSNPGEYKLSVIAERGDGSSARQDVSVLIIPKPDPNQPAPTSVDSDDTGAGSPTETEAGASGETTPSPDNGSRVAGTVNQLSRLRLGPGTSYDLVSILSENQEVVIVAVNPAGDWYRIFFGDANNGWIYSELIDPAGDISGLPVEVGDPAPTAPGINLMVMDVQVAQPVICNQKATVQITIVNNGSEDAPSIGLLGVQALLQSSAEVLHTVDYPVPESLHAGEEITLPIPVTLTAHYDREQKILVTIDRGNQVAESNEDDNSLDSDPFMLQIGTCG